MRNKPSAKLTGRHHNSTSSQAATTTAQVLWSINPLWLKVSNAKERVVESRALVLLEADAKEAIDSRITGEEYNKSKTTQEIKNIV